MLIDAPAAPSQLPPGVPAAPRGRRARPLGPRAASAVAFLAAAGLVLAYAIPGGAYDVVLRQEYAIVIWAALGIGVACGLLPRCRPSGWSLVLIGALAGYGAWTALSLGWTESAERTTEELARVVDYLGLLALLSLVLDRTTWRAAALGLGFAALAVCGIALASRLAPGAFGPNPLFSPSGTNRLSYPFGYWNAVGAWSSMAIALGLAGSIHDSSRVRRAVALGLVPVAGLTTYLSYSRAGAAGAAIAAVAVWALSRSRLTAFVHVALAAGATALAIAAVRGSPQIAHGTGSAGAGRVIAAVAAAVLIAALTAVVTDLRRFHAARVPRRLARLLTVVAAAAILLAAASAGPRLARRAWHQFSHPAPVSATDPAARLTQLSGTRYDLWRVALDAFTAHPLSGVGAGSFQFWWNRHAPNPESVRNAHSLELENMAELGAPGLLLILAVVASALVLLAAVRRRSRRRASAGAATALLAAFLVYLAQASVDWLWQTTAVTVVALSAAAIAGARLSRPRPLLRWYWRAAALVLAAGAVLLQLPAMVSTAEIRQSQAADRAGNPDRALAWANAAVGAEPWSASAYEQRALVLEAGGRTAQAAQDLGRAVDRERTNFQPWLLLARVQTELGQIAAAERDYLQARQLKPRALVFAYAPFFVTRRP